MPEASKALVVRSLVEEQEITERARLKKERAELKKQASQERCNLLVASIKLDAARVTHLRRHMFKTEEQLDALGLDEQQKAIVRQFQEPKKATAFGVESAAKLIEADTRAQAQTKRGDVNIENLTISIPEKTSVGLPAPVIIDVEVTKK